MSGAVWQKIDPRRTKLYQINKGIFNVFCLLQYTHWYNIVCYSNVQYFFINNVSHMYFICWNIRYAFVNIPLRNLESFIRFHFTNAVWTTFLLKYTIFQAEVLPVMTTWNKPVKDPSTGISVGWIFIIYTRMTQIWVVLSVLYS